MRRHSPRMADRVALKWQDGISSVVDGLLRVVAPDLRRETLKRAKELEEQLDDAEVPRIRTGAQLARLLDNLAFYFCHEETGDEDVARIAGFQQIFSDWSDLWGELGPLQRAKAVVGLAEELEELRGQGWTVHGRIDQRRLSMEGEPFEWPVAVVAVVRGGSRRVMYLGNGEIAVMPEDEESPTGAP